MSRRPSLQLRDDVTLRPLTAEDAPRMCRWVLDPAVANDMGLQAAPSLERTRSWIEQATSDETFLARAILLGGRHVGNVVLDRIDRRLACARLSIYVGESDQQSGGVGQTAIFQVLIEAFDRLQLNKVFVTVHCRNVASLKMCSKAGFVVEGILRDEFVLNGERLDLFYMGLLAPEFARLRSAMQESGGLRREVS